jgi:nucleoside-diphosphate-sugar epimerase/predicted dehydrogenase
VNLLILGSGAVVREFYLPALARLRWNSGIAVSDADASALARAKAIAPWIGTRELGYADAIRQARESGAADAVVVALPNSLHAEASACALEAGFPVLCEKPLAMSAAQCRALQGKSTATGKPLSVAMVRRLIPANRAAIAAMRAGLAGEIREVVVEHGGPYAWLSDSGAYFRKENGGILADLGIHYLDLLASIFGPLTPIHYEDDWRGGVEATCAYQLQAKASISIDLRISHLRQAANTIEFRGDRGSIVVDRSDFAACKASKAIEGLEASFSLPQPFSDPAWPIDLTSCFAQMLDDFRKTIEGGAPAVTAADAAQVVSLVEHAYGTRVRQTRTPAGDSNEPRLAPGKIVLTGGTGFIGGALVERLWQAGHEDIVVPVRGYRTCANAARFPVALPKVDLTDRAQVRNLVKGARWVFHLAYGQNESDANAITVGATQVLVEEAAAAGVEAVVVLSTMGVFGHPDSDQPVNETSPYNPTYGTYGKSKAKMEQWCLDRSRSFGRTRLVVLNPSCVYGPGGKTYTAMPAELAKLCRFAWVDGGRGIANYCYVDNLLDAILLVAVAKESDRQRFLVTDGHSTWREMLEPLLGGLGGQVPSLSAAELQGGGTQGATPSTLREVAGALLNNYELIDRVNRHPQLGPVKRRLVGRFRSQMEQVRAADGPQASSTQRIEPAPPPSWLVDLFGPTRTRFSSAKLQALGWRPRVGLAEGQGHALRWLRESGILK